MMTPHRQTGFHRRGVLTATWGAAVAVLPLTARAAVHPRVVLDRGAYERYISLMNAGDPRFADIYADDIRFVMNIRGKSNVLDFYARHKPFVKETLKLQFFCSDASGAAAEVLSELRCIRDCDDTAIFGRALKAGEVQTIRGCLLYVLNDRGLITEIKGPPPEILQPWRMAAS